MPSINAWLIGLLLLLASNIGSYFYGSHVEKGIQLGKQATVEVKKLNQTVDTVVKHSENIVSDVIKNNEIERKANEDYEKASAELRKARDENRTLVRQLGGLRIPSSVCTISAGTNGETETAGTSKRNEDLTGTIALPKQIDEDLQSASDEADEFIEGYRTLQNWVREQGFYGTTVKKP